MESIIGKTTIAGETVEIKIRPLIEATMQLRFERRPQSEGWPTKFVLQQLFKINDGLDTRYEWRDVEVVDQQNSSS